METCQIKYMKQKDAIRGGNKKKLLHNLNTRRKKCEAKEILKPEFHLSIEVDYDTKSLLLIKFNSDKEWTNLEKRVFMTAIQGRDIKSETKFKNYNDQLKRILNKMKISFKVDTRYNKFYFFYKICKN